jgi:hypothetical protein
MASTLTSAELKALIDAWLEKYIHQTVAFAAPMAPTADRLNELFNLLIVQGDNASEAIAHIRDFLTAYMQDVDLKIATDIASNFNTWTATKSAELNTAFTDLSSALTSTVNSAVQTANTATQAANLAKDAANDAATSANASKQAADIATAAANAAAGNATTLANTAAQAADNATANAIAATQTANDAAATALQAAEDVQAVAASIEGTYAPRLTVVEASTGVETAQGTATALTVGNISLTDGFSKTIKVAVNNGGVATTLQGKPVYKPGTTTAPTLVANNYYTFIYSATGNCFFVKTSSSGNALPSDVASGKTFSNNDGTDLVGTGALAVPCAQITGLSGVFGSAIQGKVVLNWTNPTDGLTKGIRIMYKTGSYPTGPNDGTVFYDSNDAVMPTTATATLTEGTTYFFRAFTYTYQNVTRLYNTTTAGAQVTGTPIRTQGQQIFTSSGTFTVPAGVTTIDIFCVGGGAGGGYQGGGGAGYTATKKGQAVTPGQTYAITVGAGGIGKGWNDFTSGGSATTVAGVLTANGGASVYDNYSGSNGGSGGGGSYNGGYGGTNGSNGTGGGSYPGGIGQGTTTKAFGETTGTLYSGGGGANGAVNNGGAGGGGNGGTDASHPPTAGAVNTGSGGGGAYAAIGANGGSGICIVRWGY